MHIKLVVPSSHNKLESGQNLMWPWVIHLQYTVTRMSLLSWENLCVISFWARASATCTFLISKLSVGVLTSVVGQLDGSCDSHCGPFHHNVDDENDVCSLLLDTGSEQLNREGTCLHVADDGFFLNDGVLLSQFPPFVDSPCIHISTMGRCWRPLEDFAPQANKIWFLFSGTYLS